MSLHNVILIVMVMVIGLFVWKQIKYFNVKKKIPALLDQGAIIVDVRTVAELGEGASNRNLNIPLNELEKRYHELDKEKTIILCCASGIRSGMALAFLREKGFRNLINAGSWKNTLPSN